MSAIARFEVLPVDKLTIDHRYQRPLDKERVKKMAANFDPRKLGTLEISLSNGKPRVFDGQHRRAVLQAVGVSEAPCLVHSDLTPAEEAELFVALQMQRKRVRPTERFKAKVFAGDPAAKAIERVVKRAGFQIGEHSTTSIRSVVTLERVYARGGNAGLAETLNLVKECWAGDVRSTDGMLIGGVWALVRDYGDRLDDTALNNLCNLSPTAILRRATGNLGAAMGGGSYTAARAVGAELVKAAGVRGRPRAAFRAKGA